MPHHFILLFPSLCDGHSLLHTGLHLLGGLDPVATLTVLTEKLCLPHFALSVHSLWVPWEYQELSGA